MSIPNESTFSGSCKTWVFRRNSWKRLSRLNEGRKLCRVTGFTAWWWHRLRSHLRWLLISNNHLHNRKCCWSIGLTWSRMSSKAGSARHRSRPRNLPWVGRKAINKPELPRLHRLLLEAWGIRTLNHLKSNLRSTCQSRSQLPAPAFFA
jgi:hypothetical protein